MGVRAIGSISLSLAFAFFSLLGIYAVSSFVRPFDITGTLVFFGFLIVGLVMFFLPLFSIHGKMQEEKKRELTSIRNQIVDVLEKHSTAQREEENATLAGIERLLALQMIDQKIANVSTWPFDTSILSRFVVIILSVTAILLSRFITNALHV